MWNAINGKKRLAKFIGVLTGIFGVNKTQNESLSFFKDYIS